MQELRKHQKDINKRSKTLNIGIMEDKEHKQQFNYKKLLRGLEEAYQVFLTPTGFAAVALAIMSICRPGDEIVISDGVYRPTQKLTDDLLKEFKYKSCLV